MKDDSTQQSLGELYRSLPMDEPSEAMDRAVLSAARRVETGTTPSKATQVPAVRRRSPWQGGLAMAACIALCVTLVMLLRDQSVDETWQEPSAKVQVEPSAAKPGVVVREQGVAERKKSVDAQPMSDAATEVSLAAPSAPATSEAEQAGLSLAKEEKAYVSPHASLYPEAWLSKIKGIAQAGDRALAEQELAAFKQLYPSYPLASLDDLLSPSEPVPAASP